MKLGTIKQNFSNTAEHFVEIEQRQLIFLVMPTLYKCSLEVFRYVMNEKEN